MTSIRGSRSRRSSVDGRARGRSHGRRRAPLEGRRRGPFDARPDPTGRRRRTSSRDRSTSGSAPAGRTVCSSRSDDPDIHWGVAEFAPRRSWSVIAATGGRPTASGSWRLASTSARSSSGTSRRRSTRTRPACRPLPAGGNRERGRHALGLGLDGSRVDVDWDREAFPYLVDVRGTTDARSTCWCCRAIRSAGRARGRPRLGEDADSSRGHAEHWQTSSSGCRIGCPTAGSCSSKSPRTPADHGRRRARDPTRAAGAHGPRRRRRRPVRANEDPTELHVWRVGRRGADAVSPRAGCAHRRARRPTSP